MWGWAHNGPCFYWIFLLFSFCYCRGIFAPQKHWTNTCVKYVFYGFFLSSLRFLTEQPTFVLYFLYFMGWLFVCFNPRLHFTSKHWTTPHCTALHYTTLGYKPASLGRYFELPFTVIRYRTRASLSLNWRKKNTTHTRIQSGEQKIHKRAIHNWTLLVFTARWAELFSPLSRGSRSASLLRETDFPPLPPWVAHTLSCHFWQNSRRKAEQRQRNSAAGRELPSQKWQKNNESSAMANPLGVRLELSLARSPCACP